jgi:hypothetical protein
MIDMESIRGELAAALLAVERLKALGEDFPALYRNAARARASLRMLQLNISDLYELEIRDAPVQAEKAAGDVPEPAREPGAMDCPR